MKTWTRKLDRLKAGGIKHSAYKGGALLMALSLAGCAHAPSTPLRVEVPVAIPCPAPQPLPRPVLPFADLAPDAPDADVLRAVVASLEILTGYAQALERQLAGYAPTPGRP